LDAFAFRNRLIEEYGTYVKSFINIQDERIAAYVDDCNAAWMPGSTASTFPQ